MLYREAWISNWRLLFQAKSGFALAVRNRAKHKSTIRRCLYCCGVTTHHPLRVQEGLGSLMVWNHPIDVHYFTKALQGWPQVNLLRPKSVTADGDYAVCRLFANCGNSMLTAERSSVRPCCSRFQCAERGPACSGLRIRVFSHEQWCAQYRRQVCFPCSRSHFASGALRRAAVSQHVAADGNPHGRSQKYAIAADEANRGDLLYLDSWQSGSWASRCSYATVTLSICRRER